MPESLAGKQKAITGVIAFCTLKYVLKHNDH